MHTLKHITEKTHETCVTVMLNIVLPFIPQQARCNFVVSYDMISYPIILNERNADSLT